MFDYHIHSKYSFDSTTKLEENIKSAIKKNIREICFTDHIDYDFDCIGTDSVFDFDEYLSEINDLKRKYENLIAIRAGVEFGLQPHTVRKCKKDVESHEFDFVIASLHSVDKMDLYAGEYYRKRTQKEAYNDYFAELNNVLNDFESYNVAGHLDIVRRYDRNSVYPRYNEYRDLVEIVLKNIISKGKGIEVNTSGIRYNKGANHPNIEILQTYYELGGEIITIGSDAHNEKDLGYGISNVIRSLKSIGFKSINTFEQMRPIYHKI